MRRYLLVFAVALAILTTLMASVSADDPGPAIEYRLVRAVAKNENGVRTEISFDNLGRVQQPLELGFLQAASGPVYNPELKMTGFPALNPTWSWMDQTRARICWLYFERQGGEGAMLKSGSSVLKLKAETRSLPGKGGTSVFLASHAVVETAWDFRVEKEFVTDGWEIWGVRSQGTNLVWNFEFSLRFRDLNSEIPEAPAPKEVVIRLDPAFGSDPVTTLWLQELPTNLRITP